MKANQPTPSRRTALAILSGGGLAALAAACSTERADQSTSSTTTTTTSPPRDTTAAVDIECAVGTPSDMAGPYPADGTNGPNVLTLDGVVRRDITTSFAGMSGTAAGVPMTLNLRVLDGADGCRPINGAAVYAWHCDDAGDYSLYSEALADQNFLRGMQAGDENGELSFTSVFPGCYPGRWPHVHFEIYESVDAATGGANAVLTSQLALPAAPAEAVFATEGYELSAQHFSQMRIEDDGVFNDGWDAQMAEASGDTIVGMNVDFDIVI